MTRPPRGSSRVLCLVLVRAVAARRGHVLQNDGVDAVRVEDLNDRWRRVWPRTRWSDPDALVVILLIGLVAVLGVAASAADALDGGMSSGAVIGAAGCAGVIVAVVAALRWLVGCGLSVSKEGLRPRAALRSFRLRWDDIADISFLAAGGVGRAGIAVRTEDGQVVGWRLARVAPTRNGLLESSADSNEVERLALELRRLLADLRTQGA